jgi:hypothetical protein
MNDVAQSFTLRGFFWGLLRCDFLQVRSAFSEDIEVEEIFGDSKISFGFPFEEFLAVVTSRSLCWQSEVVKIFLFECTGLRIELLSMGELGEIADIGLFRKLDDTDASRAIGVGTSRTAPAVLGRDSSPRVVIGGGREVRGADGLDVMELTIDDKLLVTEWPRTVDMELSVPDDIVDKGRMYSIRSENPTLAREGGLCGDEEMASFELKTVSGCETGGPGTEYERGSVSSGVRGTTPLWPPKVGETGALPAREPGLVSDPCSIPERSWFEMAADLR